jgi:hypothetical protein
MLFGYLMWPALYAQTNLNNSQVPLPHLAFSETLGNESKMNTAKS